MAIDNERVKQEATKAVNGMMSLITSVLAAPEETVTSYVSSGNRMASYQLIAVQTVVVALVNVVYKLMRNLLSKGTVYEFGSIVSGLLQNVVAVLAVAFLGAFIVSILAKTAGKDVDFNTGLAIASLQAIVITPVYAVYRIVACFGVSILTNLTSILYSGAEVLAIVLTMYGFMVIIPDKKKTFYNVGIYFVALLLIEFIIRKIMN